MSAEERAKHALRDTPRSTGQRPFMMPDQSEVKTLRERDKQKYGSPDGLTFNAACQKH